MKTLSQLWAEKKTATILIKHTYWDGGSGNDGVLEVHAADSKYAFGFWAQTADLLQTDARVTFALMSCRHELANPISRTCAHSRTMYPKISVPTELGKPSKEVMLRVCLDCFESKTVAPEAEPPTPRRVYQALYKSKCGVYTVSTELFPNEREASRASPLFISLIQPGFEVPE